MHLFIVLTGVVLLVVLIALKLHTFIALLFTCFFTGLLTGMPFTKVVSSVNSGVGTTLSSVALILALGALYGKLLQETRITQKIVQMLSRAFKGKSVQWAVLATGIVVGIPLFYNAGFVILVPLVFTLAAALNIPVLYVGLPMATALSVTHGFLPPHPGPTTLIGLFGASTGKTLAYGLAIGLPVAVFCGIFLTRLMVPYRQNTNMRAVENKTVKDEPLPPSGLSFLLALLPVALITLGTAGAYFFPSNKSTLFTILQEPVTAFLFSLVVLMLCLWMSPSRTVNASAESFKSIASILLIIAAGGAFKQVLIDSGTAALVADSAKTFAVPPLIFAWLLAAVLRLAIGSATVASITAAGMVLPLLTHGLSPELMVLAVGAGSLFGSHVNDTGFWMFKEYFNLSLKQTFRTWTVVESCISLLGLGGVLLANALL